MAINIVLDIDGVLACSSTSSIRQACFFKNNGAILTAIKTHYLFPGVIEFIQFLFATKNVKVSFFSSGEKQRNLVFVQQLLKLARVKEEVRVLSEGDLIELSSEEKEEIRKHGLHPGNKHKDLTKVLSKEDRLEDAIIIDDDSSYIAQPKNFLRVPCTDKDCFDKLDHKRLDYHADGYQFLRYTLAPEKKSNPEKRAVRELKQVVIIKKETGFELCFVDKKTGAFRTHPLESQEIIAELNKMGESDWQIKKLKLVQALSDLVESLGGISKKICRKANRIYYVAGALFAAMQQAKDISLSESLSRLPFKSHKNDALYFLGLKVLQQFNKDLQLITPEIYHKECTNLPATEQERLQLQCAMKNEYEGCCIM